MANEGTDAIGRPGRFDELQQVVDGFTQLVSEVSRSIQEELASDRLKNSGRWPA